MDKELHTSEELVGKDSEIFRFTDALTRILNYGNNYNDGSRLSAFQYNMIAELLEAEKEDRYMYRLSLANQVDSDYIEKVKCIVVTDYVYDFLYNMKQIPFRNKFEYVYSQEGVSVGSLVETTKSSQGKIETINKIVLDCRKVYQFGPHVDVKILNKYNIDGKITRLTPNQFDFLLQAFEFYSQDQSIDEMKQVVDIIGRLSY